MIHPIFVRPSTLRKFTRATSDYISIRRDGIYFPKNICARFDLKYSGRIAFVQIGKYGSWGFDKLQQDDDAFILVRRGTGLQIRNKELAETMITELRMRPPIFLRYKEIIEFGSHVFYMFDSSKPL